MVARDTTHAARRFVRVTVLAAAAIVAMSACKGQSAGLASTDRKPPQPAATSEAAVNHTPFDGARAFEHVKRQVGFGPRPAGSHALAQTRAYITSELKSYGLKVTEEPFSPQTPAGKIDMVNVIAELPGESSDVLIIASHYDTKRLKDFVGANDGGSSTGALLEIARVLAVGAKTRKPELTIQFVFFDGEEAVVEWEGDDNTYGSRHFVDSREDSGAILKIRGLVLLDMIGDKDLNIYRESYSTAPLTDIIWNTAASLGYSKYFLSGASYIEDDHVPFLQSGVPAVDVIDFHFGTDQHYGAGGPQNAYWHTPNDTLDKISAESLKIVGDTVITALPKLVALLKR
jgi:hypothetical protein